MRYEKGKKIEAEGKAKGLIAVTELPFPSETFGQEQSTAIIVFTVAAI